MTKIRRSTERNVKSKEQLEAEIAPLQAALMRLKDDEILAESKALVGKCFKYRNCYSCPKPDEYWWLYVKVTGVGDYWPITFQFQTDKDGKIEVEVSKHHSRLSGYTEITDAEFNREWRKVQKRIGGMTP